MWVSPKDGMKKRRGPDRMRRAALVALDGRELLDGDAIFGEIERVAINDFNLPKRPVLWRARAFSLSARIEM